MDNNRKQRKQTLILGVLGLGGGLLLACCGGLAMTADRHSRAVKPPSATAERDDFFRKSPLNLYLTSDQITALYDSNSIKADKSFKDEWLLITGKVRSVDRDILKNPFILLESKQMIGVQCIFPKTAESTLEDLSPGDVVFIAGFGRGEILGLVIFNDCQLLPKPPPS